MDFAYSSVSLRGTESVIRMLNFGVDAEADNWAETWKIVVFDDTGKDVISELLKIGELRKQGVTLNLCVTNLRVFATHRRHADY